MVVDGRADQIYPLSFIEESNRAAFDEATFNDWNSKLNGDWVLASNTPNHPSHLFLNERFDWKMIFWSEAATIYIRTEKYPALASKTLKFLPMFLNSQKKLAELLSDIESQNGIRDLKMEIEEMLRWTHSDLRLHLWLCLVDAKLGLKKESEDRLQRILSEFPNHPLLQEFINP